MLGCIIGLCLLDVSSTHNLSPLVITENVSRHCQVFSVGQNHSCLRTTGLDEDQPLWTFFISRNVV